MSSSQTNPEKTKKKNKLETVLKWSKKKKVWYLTILTILVIFGMFKPDAAIKLIQAFTQALLIF